MRNTLFAAAAALFFTLAPSLAAPALASEGGAEFYRVSSSGAEFYRSADTGGGEFTRLARGGKSEYDVTELGTGGEFNRVA